MNVTSPEMPPPRPHGWPSCPPSALLPLTVLLVIVNVPRYRCRRRLIGLIAADGAVGNRHRPIVGDAAAPTERERSRHTSMVPSDETVADHEHPTAVVDAAARAAASWEAVKCRGVAVDVLFVSDSIALPPLTASLKMPPPSEAKLPVTVLLKTVNVELPAEPSL